MDRYLGRYEPQLYALLRIVAGFLFLCHGAQKLLGWFGGVDQHGATVPIVSLFGLAGIIELVGGALIAVGLLTPWIAFIASGEMAFAYFMAHQPHGGLPIANQGELAVLYSFLWLYVASRGSGPLSVDAAMRGK
jgi:putative oxidoreductase